MFPDAKFGVGPAIDNGFYYDFDLPRTLIPEDLPILEKKMKDIIKNNVKFEKAVIAVDEAKKNFDSAGQPMKIELIDDILKADPAASTVSVFRLGNFVDLCAGPHLDSTGEIDPEGIALTKIYGAYWKGDEKNPMLQRIYGVSFPDKKSLDVYHKMMEEAAKRDHRKLGKELDLFVFSELVGPGLPLFTPKGTVIIEELKKDVEEKCRRHGFEKVMTPHLAKIGLYELSGHAQKFSDELFHVTSRHKQDYVMKPVQCPHQTQLYDSKPRSYKDLPVRYMESERQYRAEKPGEIGGLSRVIAITVEDGHSFCRVDQVKDEVKAMVSIIRDFYSPLGLWGNHWVSLSVRDYAHPEKYIGEPADWDVCEKMLQEVSDEMGLDAVRREGEAALYGPKLDFMFRDAAGREVQIPTVQIDFATPKRFNLSYTNEKGEKIPPVMVHRAILGSYERFLALLIEHFAGAFPLWLSPVQVEVIPVSENQIDYARQIRKQLKNEHIRIQLKEPDETLGKRIRNAEREKIPFMLIVGAKEQESQTVSVRSRDKGEVGTMSLDEFLALVKKQITERT